jgi:hypothetical protein
LQKVFILYQRKRVEKRVGLYIFQQVLYSIYRYIIPKAIVQVVDIAVFGIPVYQIDNNIDSTIGAGIKGEVVY